jgi:Na+/H+ antiporter NhaD/arsenite permease-like protein
VLELWLVLPFGALLLCIAVLPLAAGHWFEKNSNKGLVALLFGLPVLLYLIVSQGQEGRSEVLATAEEYVSFIVLLTALFTISGGVYLTGHLLGSPTTNLAFLLAGAVLANLVGTTGAAMLLIRPLLRANAVRKHARHVIVFAIFLICNVGGLLTPLGDPPLFLGFLRGVDFFWTLRLLPQWAFTVAAVGLVFLVFEIRAYRREDKGLLRREMQEYLPLGIAGKVNLLFLAGVIVAVLASGPLARLGELAHFPFVRELVMVGMILASLKLGPNGPRKANHFSWDPIVEVAIIFGGIFAAMIPALAILEARGGELGLDQPWQFFWVTGALSSFLDNAPTYLTFASTAQGLLEVPHLAGLMDERVVSGLGASPSLFLAAISAGAVFMGANSYIGNAPNFMVKSIAERSGMKMPSFFGYMLYSGAVLLPIFLLVTIVFFISGLKPRHVAGASGSERRI